MKVIAVLCGLFAFFCLGLGVATLFGVFEVPPTALSDNITAVAAFPGKFTWDVWFWLSALLFLASIACKPGGRRGGGGEEF